MAEEYISRDAAKEDLQKAFSFHNYAGSIACSVIDKIPAADVVEVVRCKDCKYAQYGAVPGQDWCADAEIHPDFFCADGERKDNG